MTMGLFSVQAAPDTWEMVTFCYHFVSRLKIFFIFDEKMNLFSIVDNSQKLGKPLYGPYSR